MALKTCYSLLHVRYLFSHKRAPIDYLSCHQGVAPENIHTLKQQVLTPYPHPPAPLLEIPVKLNTFCYKFRCLSSHPSTPMTFHRMGMNIFWSSTICCCIPISCHTVSLFDTITSNGVHILLNSIVEAAKKNSYFAVKITGMLGLT